jgi:hypothetical protein
MPVTSALVTRYFQLLVSRQFTEAERELERLKQKMQKTEWNRGYFRALFGMMLARRSNGDSSAFFPPLDANDRENWKHYKHEFGEHVKNRLHSDFDRGFFSAWNDFIRVLSRMVIPESANVAQSEKPASEAQTGQASIDSFVDEEKD